MGFIHKCIVCFLLYRWHEKLNDYESKLLQRKGLPVYWNVPSFQCDAHKQNFSQLLEKYNIIQNANARFRGDNITILYDPGSFPAILKDGNDFFLRNGGLPQRGNLTLHLELFSDIVEQLIPDEQFRGLGIIDFESWRPVFRQNFGVLTPYQDISIAEVKKNHPLWPQSWVKKEAARQFEESARVFMEKTLEWAKKLRPNATWGYYAYPYCFNMSPNNMKQACPKDVQQENDRTGWLFSLADNFYPSLYLGDTRLNATNKIQLVQGRIDESTRLKKQLNLSKKILPYFWYKYQDTMEFVTKVDLLNTLTVLANSTIDGVILWGSSRDVNTKVKCQQLYEYIDNVFGPTIQMI